MTMPSITIEQLQREISNLRELFEVRLDAMDKAVVLFDQNLTRVPTEVDRQIAHLKELTFANLNSLSSQMDGRFGFVDSKFNERDIRTEQAARDSKIAVDAALQAAKEAVGEQNKSSALAIAKSEAATNKQIDQMGSLIQATMSAVSTQTQDNKERITRLESVKTGSQENSANRQSTILSMTAILGAVAAIAVVIIDIVLRTHS
jgi:hypothetical protein